MEKRQQGSIWIISPKGYLNTIDALEDLDRTLRTLIESGNRHLVVNLQATQHLNSTALGILIRTHNNYVRRGGSMVLCSVDKRIENIFIITKLSLVFNVYPTEEQAIAALLVRR